MCSNSKNLVLILFIGLTMLAASCTKTPEACFVIDKGSGSTHVNEEVQFDASCSKDADSYNWEFGDGTTQAGTLTKHKYTVAGTYSVKLTANHGSKSAINTQSITISN